MGNMICVCMYIYMVVETIFLVLRLTACYYLVVHLEQVSSLFDKKIKVFAHKSSANSYF